jgi:hypothetical protein
VDELDCRSFAEKFEGALVGTVIESVDYDPPKNRLPVVVASEYETTWPVDIAGRKLTIQPPKTKAFAEFRLGAERKAWFVDLIRDMGTGRAVKELQLPSSSVVFELLNGPCPPSFEHIKPPRVGDGTDSINIRSSGKKEVVDVYLPTAEEIFEEIVREHGFEPKWDEKRSAYLPVIKRFGGLHRAAAAFSDRSGAVLAALQNKEKTLAEIRGTCQMGADSALGQSYVERTAWLFGAESERIKRIGQRRFARYARNQAPENLRLSSVLEFWADRSIVKRRWRIGPCSHCNQLFFEAHLDIRGRISCPACGHRIRLPEKVPLAYSLDDAVRHAMSEGVVPVVLTGRFLQNMTNKGFFWLPGMKYQHGSESGDIDLLACCDGLLVFCECKTRSKLNEETIQEINWDGIVDQFVVLSNTAEKCKADVVVLASLVNEYPAAVRERVKAVIGNRIQYLLLDKKDLENGFRKLPAEGKLGRLTLHHLMRNPFPEKPRQRSPKPHSIQFGWGTTGDL